MVDFRRQLAAKAITKPTDPLALYASLDRKHDKGPLRPAQESVLTTWYSDRRSNRDVIVKLHTGQGKTLIGLLMLQSRLNAGNGPAVYLCPNNHLVQQTVEQAEQFGLKVCTADDDLPSDFLSGHSILVTSVQKLFNGRTKFGLHNESITVETVLMDDAHACVDAIRESCRIRIPKDEPAYDALRTLFGGDLEQQGQGTFADIENGDRNAILPVPYWAWTPRESEVAAILSKNKDRKSIKFAWPLLKDMLAQCQCVISGAAIEIEPYLAPLNAFGSFETATHRIFMSATVTNDAFLIKGLRLSPQTISSPLTYSAETWSGEKMVLIPSLIDESLDRGAVIDLTAVGTGRRAGRVALTPSFAMADHWKAAGARVATAGDIQEAIASLHEGEFEKTLVLANRYDGIDLPDASCRVLVFDSLPFSENLIDLVEERCRAGSEATLMRTLRTIEQGMGRSVRGEKDYSVVIVTGADLVSLLRDSRTREHLSAQMQKQIDIGLSIVDFSKEDQEQGESGKKILRGLVQQCLGRDDGWKAFYKEQMDELSTAPADDAILKVFQAELEAEQLFEEGEHDKAEKRLQAMLDSRKFDPREVGWYLQQRARYKFEGDRLASGELQAKAHKKNRRLLKPEKGITVAQLTVVSHARAERLIEWLKQFDSYADLSVRISDIIARLTFGTKADSFESALDDLSRALGFAGERPDDEWKEGPDNLWALDSETYLLLECKSEVDVRRVEIAKRETEQMNRSAAWFAKHYPGKKVRRVIIHPAGKIESAAAFTHTVEGMGVKEMGRLVKTLQSFFKSFENRNFADLSKDDLQGLFNAHSLTVNDLMTGYARKLKDLKV